MRVGLLGAVEVVDLDGSVVPLAGVRLRGLLARLALDAGVPVSSAVLVDDLWGASPPDSAANALQALVSRLRRAIGAARVVTDPRGYRLQMPRADVDALQFAELMSAGSLALLREALALWRGPALAGLDELPFTATAAARLEERRATALEQAARLAQQRGEPATDLDALAAQLDATPLRESTAALLARGLHAVGRQADALAVLDSTRARLVDELGVDPGAEWDAARMAVLRHEPAPAAAPTPLHTGLSSFVGRTEDVERLRGLLTVARLVTLTGPGGAGKTRLAREVAANGPVAELAALTAAEQLPAGLMAAVGTPELVTRSDEPVDVTSRLVAALAGRELLLVIDNCEHLVEAVALLTERLLAGAPRLRVLATSREPLGVPGEVLHPVGALPDVEAVRLFAERARAAQPGFDPTADAPAVLEVCRRLDGQPLPIELAAARTRTLSVAEIAARLDDRFRLLTSGARTALPRHRTLRAVVDWSWDLLAEPERAVARRLGAFAGGATAAAAEAVCAGPDVPATDVFEHLASLVDKSLVVAVAQPDGAPTRYRMLETIRVYAVEKLAAAGEQAGAEAVHAAFFLDIAETAEPHLRNAEQLAWLTVLRAEADEIAIAMRRAIGARDAVTAHRYVAAMGWSWMISGLIDDATTFVDQIAALDGPVPTDVLARSVALQAMTALGHGDHETASAYAHRVEELAASLPRPWHPVLELAAPVHRLFAAQDVEPIRRLSTESESSWVRGFALIVHAQFAENAGDITLQRALVRQAHGIFLELGERFGLGMVLHTLGELEELGGDLDSAQRVYEEAMVLATELANRDDLPQFTLRRAMLDTRRGDLPAARKGIQAVIAGSEDDGPLYNGSLVMAYAALADIERLDGDLPAAREYMHTAQALATDQLERLSAPQLTAFVALGDVSIELTAGDLDAARIAMLTALDSAAEAEDGPVSGMVSETAARFAITVGDVGQAAVMLGIAVARRGAADLGNPEVVAAYARVRAELGAAAEAVMEGGRTLPRDESIAVMREFISSAAGGVGAPAARPASSPASRGAQS